MTFVILSDILTTLATPLTRTLHNHNYCNDLFTTTQFLLVKSLTKQGENSALL